MLRPESIGGNMTKSETDALDALFALGKSKGLVPATRDEGQALILEAAHQGHGEAAHLMALMLATSPGLEDHWGFALAYLGRAAKTGHRLSQRTLAFLAHDADAGRAIADGAVLVPETWHQLHDAIDIPAWRATPAPKIVSEAPYIAIAEGFLPPDLCDWIVERGSPGQKRALVYDLADSKGVAARQRTNTEACFAFDELDVAMLLATDRILQLTGARAFELEQFSVLHYVPGQEFRPHFDFLDPAVPSDAAEIANIGQRFMTLLVYLNDDYTGGETDFPELDYRYKGRKGDALLFRNLDPDGAPDRRTRHAGLSPLTGEKWLLSQWTRKKL